MTAAQLQTELKSIKQRVYQDIKSLFFDFEANRYDIDKNPTFKPRLERIIRERELYVGVSSNKQKQIDIAIQSIALHFTIKYCSLRLLKICLLVRIFQESFIIFSQEKNIISWEKFLVIRLLMLLRARTGFNCLDC